MDTLKTGFFQNSTRSMKKNATPLNYTTIQLLKNQFLNRIIVGYGPPAQIRRQPVYSKRLNKHSAPTEA